MTLMKKAAKGVVTSEMKRVAEREGVNVDLVVKGIAEGTIVIPRNVNHHTFDPVGIGKGLHTKVNADIAKGNGRAIAWDEKMARARKASDWDEQIRLAIDPRKARKYREERIPSAEEACTMCGEYCPVVLIKEYIGGNAKCH